jgi:hypothetical protein
MAAQGFKGMPELIAKIKSIPPTLIQEVKNLVADTSQQIVIDAVNNVRANGSTNYGGLMQSINAVPKNNGLGQEIMAAVEYAPAIEWGTKGKAKSIDPRVEEYASQFKGTPSGGTWSEFLEAINDWVKKKGIASGKEVERVAFLIARSIYIHGVAPKPFFFPAWFKNTADFETKLKDVLKRVVE